MGSIRGEGWGVSKEQFMDGGELYEELHQLSGCGWVLSGGLGMIVIMVENFIKSCNSCQGMGG